MSLKYPSRFLPFANEFNLYTRIIEARKRIRFSKTKNRHSVLKFKSCKNIVVDNVILDESASWTPVIESCDNVMIKNIVIDNDMRVANTDGIDLFGDGCVIESCFIATGDDDIVLKPIYNKMSNVKISNCVMTTFANCFKIGTESPCDVENVKMQGCEFSYLTKLRADIRELESNRLTAQISTALK